MYLRKITLMICLLITININGEIIKWRVANKAPLQIGVKDCVGEIEIKENMNTSVNFGNVDGVDKITLPTNGEIDFGDDGGISFKPQESGENTCSDQKIYHVDGSVIRHWLDPEAWEGTYNEATPDTERIPCFGDTVSFSSQSGSYIQLPNSKQKIRGIQVDDQAVNIEDLVHLADRLGSQYIKFLLNDNDETGLEIEENYCQSSTGCPCQEKIPEVDCSQKKCKPLHCNYPIRPEGFCCDICGGAVKFVSDSKFHWEKFKMELIRYLKDYENVIYDASIMPNGFVLVVLTQEQYDGASVYLLDEIVLKLGHYFKGEVFRMVSTDKRGYIVTVFFSTLVSVAAVFGGLYLWFYRDTVLRASGSQGHFIRFRNREHSAVESIVSAEEVTIDTEFGNPLYASGRSSIDSPDAGMLQGEPGIMETVQLSKLLEKHHEDE